MILVSFKSMSSQAMYVSTVSCSVMVDLRIRYLLAGYVIAIALMIHSVHPYNMSRASQKLAPLFWSLLIGQFDFTKRASSCFSKILFPYCQISLRLGIVLSFHCNLNCIHSEQICCHIPRNLMVMDTNFISDLHPDEFSMTANILIT